MADSNYIKQPFGLNVKLPERTIQQVQETAATAAGGLLNPLFGFIEENQPVFNGNVSNEIEKYNLMMYNISAALRRDNVNGEFDVQG